MSCHLHLKVYLKAKERIMETHQIFHHAKIYNLQKKSSKKKRNQNPSRYYYNTLLLLKSQVSTQAKMSSGSS
jgi:hypothetical protein